MNRRTVGAEYEARAAEYLAGLGYQIIEKNFRCHIGEIDIIARDQGYLVFAEVKYRSHKGRGYALEAVDYRKQAVISRVASYYLVSKKLPEEYPCRFDVIGIDGDKITLIKNAFELPGF